MTKNEYWAIFWGLASSILVDLVVYCDPKEPKIVVTIKTKTNNEFC